MRVSVCGCSGATWYIYSMAEPLGRSAITAVYKHDHVEESHELTHRY